MTEMENKMYFDFDTKPAFFKKVARVATQIRGSAKIVERVAWVYLDALAASVASWIVAPYLAPYLARQGLHWLRIEPVIVVAAVFVVVLAAKAAVSTAEAVWAALRTCRRIPESAAAPVLSITAGLVMSALAFGPTFYLAIHL